MKTASPQPKRFQRPLAMALSALLAGPMFVACSADYPQNSAPPPPVDDTVSGRQPYPNQSARQPYPNQPQERRGLSNKQKVAILVGAAALYYLYNQHKNKSAQEQGPQGKYYLSKNGRVYYRDAQNRAHWVTPPSEGIQVPESEAQQYRDFQGYNGRSTGRTLEGLGQQQGTESIPAPAY